MISLNDPNSKASAIDLTLAVSSSLTVRPVRRLRVVLHKTTQFYAEQPAPTQTPPDNELTLIAATEV